MFSHAARREQEGLVWLREEEGQQRRRFRRYGRQLNACKWGRGAAGRCARVLSGKALDPTSRHDTKHVHAEPGAGNASTKRKGAERMDGTGTSTASKYVQPVSPERQNSKGSIKQATPGQEKSILHALREMPVIQKSSLLATALSALTSRLRSVPYRLFSTSEITQCAWTAFEMVGAGASRRRGARLP